MANSKSADKRARQNKKRYELKHAQRSMVRTSVKATAKAVEVKDKKAAEVFKSAQSTVDKMANKKKEDLFPIFWAVRPAPFSVIAVASEEKETKGKVLWGAGRLQAQNRTKAKNKKHRKIER